MATLGTVLTGYMQREAVRESSGNRFANGIAWVQGELTPLHEARIPLIDQGFLHGDLTYDVPAVWDGRIFRFDDHLDRLEVSCKKLRMRLPLPKEEIRDIIYDMVAKSGIRDAYVELIVTRGLQFVRTSMDANGTPSTPNLYLLVQPYIFLMPLEYQGHGAGAIITRSVRRIPPGAIDPTVKNLQWGDFIRGIFEAQDRESHYPFLTDGDGNLTEGAGYNVFLVKDGVLSTPQRGVLEGVTRKTVIEIAEKKGIPVRVEHVPVGDALEADEIFMCTTAGGVMPIVLIEGKPVNDAKPGPITSAIWDEYWALHYDPVLSKEISYGEEVAEAAKTEDAKAVEESKETPEVKEAQETSELPIRSAEVAEVPVAEAPSTEVPAAATGVPASEVSAPEAGSTTAAEVPATEAPAVTAAVPEVPATAEAPVAEAPAAGVSQVAAEAPAPAASSPAPIEISSPVTEVSTPDLAPRPVYTQA